jgi:hypothetical protein
MDGNNIRTPADGQSEGRPASATVGPPRPATAGAAGTGQGSPVALRSRAGIAVVAAAALASMAGLPRCKRRERRGAGDQPRARRQPGVHPVEPHGVPPHGYGPSAGGGSARRPVRTPPGAPRRTPRHARRVRGVRRRAVFRGLHRRTRRPGVLARPSSFRAASPCSTGRSARRTGRPASASGRDWRRSARWPGRSSAAGWSTTPLGARSSSSTSRCSWARSWRSCRSRRPAPPGAGCRSTGWVPPSPSSAWPE